MHTYKNENTEALLGGSKDGGLEVSGDISTWPVMSVDQDALRSHNIGTDNSSFERVEEFKYLGTTLTHQNSIQEEIKNRIMSVNTLYHLVDWKI
jgi:hypothetical protein